MRKIIFIISLLMVASCGKDQANFTLKGNVKGLKKGTVYLQKIEDTLLVSVDSIKINGNAEFELHTYLDSPEVLYLKLDKQDEQIELIPFFADKGITEIQTTLKNFFIDAKITGSKQQEKLEEYKAIMSRFQDKNLELIMSNLEAQKDQDSVRIDSVLKAQDNLIVRKYLYTINFAINNKDSEIAPYLALSEISDANIKYLDTINNALTPSIQSSKYGKELQKLIEERKKE